MQQQGNFTVDSNGTMYINGVKVDFNQNYQPKQKTILDMYMGPIIDAEFKTKEEIKETEIKEGK